MKPIRITAANPKIDLELPPGNLGATLVGGLGGWQEVERIEDVSLTDWSGQEPLRQDISVLLDGWAKGDPVDRELNTLLKLARDANGEAVPPVFKVEGPVYFEGKFWVLPPNGLDLSGGEIETIRRSSDGALLRQEVILHLLEYVHDVFGRKRKRPPNSGIGDQKKGPAVGKPIPLTHTTRKGESFPSIATDIYGEWWRWAEIADKNPGLPRSPFMKLPEGRLILLPEDTSDGGGRGGGASASAAGREELISTHGSASRATLILNDYHRFAIWAERHGHNSHMGSGEWYALLGDYADNQGVSKDQMLSMHGSIADPAEWRSRFDEGER